jgi:protein TonB
VTSTVDSSLADAVQANALGGNTCRIVVTTSVGKGFIYIRDGGIVDATYGDLLGEGAFCALVNAPDPHFVVNTGLTSDLRRIHSSFQGLMLSAMTRRFENTLPVPRFAPDPDLKADTRPVSREMLPPALRDPFPPAQASTEFRPANPLDAKPRAAVLRSRAAAPPVPPPAASPAPARKAWIAVAVGALVLLAAGGAWFASHARAPEPAAAPRTAAGTAAPQAPVEADSLTEPADAPPKLKVGPAPRSPEPDAAVSPTIVCRILIDEQGRVRDARIFRSRLDLASFEDAALVAVREWTFEPARRGGTPVPVWVNWPVTFP